MSPRSPWTVLLALCLLICSGCGTHKSVRQTPPPAASPPPLPVVDCPASYKRPPPEIPIAETGDPNTIAIDDDAIVRAYGEVARQLWGLIRCVNDWHTRTTPKP